MPLAQRLFLFVLLGYCLVLSVARSPLHAQQPDLFRELTQLGLEFDDLQRVTMSLPALQAGMTDSARLEALDKLAGKQRWDRFSRDAVTAPVVVDIDTIDDPSGERLGLLVHNAFVVYATLETLRDRELMGEMFAPTLIDSPPIDSPPIDSPPIDSPPNSSPPNSSPPINSPPN
ncbi:MAG: hypothetical protein ABI557_20335, partial [Aureliella sp.]